MPKNLFYSLEEAESWVNTHKHYDAYLIAGPTTSGKSSFAIRLAKILNGVVINTDSMQVYQDLHILTARPFPDEMENIPHWLYGFIDGAQNYSVGHYIIDALKVLYKAKELGLTPIFVGGTGLYFKALLDGLSPIPEIPDSVREKVRAWTEGKETLELYKALKKCDPEMSEKLKSNDRLRIMRALEVFEATGYSLLHHHNKREAGILSKMNVHKFFLSPEREVIRKKINERFLIMLKGGALEEVQNLEKRGLDPLLPVMRAHGVPGFIKYIRGEWNIEQAIEKGQSDTRHYAKRQMTWARHQMDGWDWVEF